MKRNKINSFIPERLTEAREARGFTKTEIAKTTGVSHQMISKYEKGQSEPSAITLNAISDTLNLPLAFFIKDHEMMNPVVFFRSQAAARIKTKKISSTRILWLQRVQEYFEKILDFPDVNLPMAKDNTSFSETSLSEIEDIALYLRRHWGVGLEPISNLTHLLEKNGIIISRSTFFDLKIDACSTWQALKRPYVLLSYDKGSSVRSRFDLAHELGHLLLHSRLDHVEFNNKTNYKKIEKEANHFASAFLLPEEPFSEELKVNSLGHYITLKEKWRVSIAAMLYRAEALGILSDYQVLHMRKTLAKNKMRTKEPLDDKITFEKPQALKQAIELILHHDVKSKGQIVNELGLSREDIEVFCNLGQGALKEENKYNDNIIQFNFKKSQNEYPLSK